MKVIFQFKQIVSTNDASKISLISCWTVYKVGKLLSLGKGHVWMVLLVGHQNFEEPERISKIM